MAGNHVGMLLHDRQEPLHLAAAVVLKGHLDEGLQDAVKPFQGKIRQVSLDDSIGLQFADPRQAGGGGQGHRFRQFLVRDPPMTLQHLKNPQTDGIKLRAGHDFPLGFYSTSNAPGGPREASGRMTISYPCIPHPGNRPQLVK